MDTSGQLSRSRSNDTRSFFCWSINIAAICQPGALLKSVAYRRPDDLTPAFLCPIALRWGSFYILGRVAFPPLFRTVYIRVPADFEIYTRCSAEGGYFRGQFNWATLLLKAGHVQEAANWLERSANGGNQPVRLAVLALITTCPHQPLQALANRLQPRLEAQAA